MVGRMLAGHPRSLGHPVMVGPGLVVVQTEGMTVVVVMRVTLVGDPATLVVEGDPVGETQADHLEDLEGRLVEVVVGDPPEDHHLHQVMILLLLQVMILDQMVGMIGVVVVVLEMVAGVQLHLLHLPHHRLPQGTVTGPVEEEEDDLLPVTLVAAA